MKIIIHPTGHEKVTFESLWEFHHTEMLEKRGVHVGLYFTKIWPQPWLATMDYLTSWGLERPFTRWWVSGSPQALGEHLREAAGTILPPGAGFPATPDYATRQAKLVGMMSTITLVAIGEVLAQAQQMKEE